MTEETKKPPKRPPLTEKQKEALRAEARELLEEAGVDNLQIMANDLNRLLDSNYSYADVWKWFNKTAPSITCRLYLKMKARERNWPNAFRDELEEERLITAEQRQEIGALKNRVQALEKRIAIYERGDKPARKLRKKSEPK